MMVTITANTASENAANLSAVIFSWCTALHVKCVGKLTHTARRTGSGEKRFDVDRAAM
jgi:hypothetical protein